MAVARNALPASVRAKNRYSAPMSSAEASTVTMVWPEIVTGPAANVASQNGGVR